MSDNTHNPINQTEKVIVQRVHPDSNLNFMIPDLLSVQPQLMEQDIDPSGLLTIRRQLTLGASPELYLEWHASPMYLDTGYRVNIFRNTHGFTTLYDAIPLEQVSHGSLVVDTNRNDGFNWLLTEGDHYVTAMLTSPTPRSVIDRATANLRRKFTGSTTRVLAFIRFTTSVPSAAVTTDRIEQDARLHEVMDRNLKSRERLARRMNRPNREFEISRHAKRTEIETDKRISEFMQIKKVFAEHRESIQTNPKFSQSERDAAIDQLDALERAQLSASNFPFIDHSGFR